MGALGHSAQRRGLGSRVKLDEHDVARFLLEEGRRRVPRVWDVPSLARHFGCSRDMAKRNLQRARKAHWGRLEIVWVALPSGGQAAYHGALLGQESGDRDTATGRLLVEVAYERRILAIARVAGPCEATHATGRWSGQAWNAPHSADYLTREDHAIMT